MSISDQAHTDYKIYKPYAKAIFSFAQKSDSAKNRAKDEKNNCLENWSDFLIASSNLMNNESVYNFMDSPDYTVESKFNFLWGLLTDYYNSKKNKLSIDNLDVHMSNFLRLLFENKRIFVLTGISNMYEELLLELNNKLSVEVVSAVELSKKNINVLSKLIEKKYKQEVEMNIVLDQSLIAGLKIKIGDRVIDGSMSTKLDRLAYQICSD